MIQTSYDDLPDGSLYLSEARVARRPYETLPSTCWSVWRREDADFAVCLIDWTGEYQPVRSFELRWIMDADDLANDMFADPNTTLWAITRDQYDMLLMLSRHVPHTRADQQGCAWTRMVEAWRLNLSRDVT